MDEHGTALPGGTILPADIETRSFAIIRSELLRPLDPAYEQVVLRVIHTTADFEYMDSMAFSDGVMDIAVAALRAGMSIVSDTNMVKAGVDKTRLAAFGGEAQCFMADEDVATSARANGTTRAVAAVDKAAEMAAPCIFAIGNAPTALLRICELHASGKLSPALVIGVPVGFVSVVEAKETLMQSGIPYIVARGRKGGSNIAAAICNALLRMAGESTGS